MFWLEPVNPEPLSPQRPVLDVKVLSLAGRTKMQTLSATVRSYQGKLLLHNVTVINGRLKAEIDENVAKLRGENMITQIFTFILIGISTKALTRLILLG